MLNHAIALQFYWKDNNVDEYIIMRKLPKDEAVKATWINTKLKGRKQLILHTFVPTSLMLINLSPVFNKIIPSPAR